MADRTGIADINTEIKKRRWRYLDHMLRLDNENITRKAVKWTPPGKKKPGRPKGTWRRTIETEKKSTGYNWNNITRIVNYRS